MQTETTPSGDAAPKLYAARRRTVLQKATYRTNTDTTLRMRRLRSRYAELIGREVSTSLITRRAIELLEDRLANVVDDADALHERCAVLRHLGA